MIKEQLIFSFCIYMHTMKRVSRFSAARYVCTKCRELEDQLTHHIYIEKAYMKLEIRNNRNISCKTWEFGLKYFQNDSEYIIKYMDFLMTFNEYLKIRQLFEISLDKLNDKDHIEKLFKKMINYESKSGDLNSVSALEKQVLSRYLNKNVIELYTDRYRIQNENSISKLGLSYLDDSDKEKIEIVRIIDK